jgi:hypothetical protein
MYFQLLLDLPLHHTSSVVQTFSTTSAEEQCDEELATSVIETQDNANVVTTTEATSVVAITTTLLNQHQLLFPKYLLSQPLKKHVMRNWLLQLFNCKTKL